MNPDSYLVLAGYAIFSVFALATLVVFAGGLLATKSAQNHLLNQKLKKREEEITRWADAYDRETGKHRYANDTPRKRHHG